MELSHNIIQSRHKETWQLNVKKATEIYSCEGPVWPSNCNAKYEHFQDCWKLTLFAGYVLYYSQIIDRLELFPALGYDFYATFQFYQCPVSVSFWNLTLLNESRSRCRPVSNNVCFLLKWISAMHIYLLVSTSVYSE